MPTETTKAPAGPGPESTATGSVRSGSSTLGKARDSGLKVQDKVDEHQKKIDEAADQVGK